MDSSLSDTVTRLLGAARDGDAEALNALFPLVYDELHGLAHQRRRQWRGDNTLNTTALVHEAYLKLVDQSKANFAGRVHFLKVASTAMRHILINYAERRQALKRGGGVQKLPLDEHRALAEGAIGLSRAQADDLMALDDALRALEAISERQSRIVECRFFGGMTNEETAEALGISTATVKRDWRLARAWLFRQMRTDLLPPAA